MEYSYATCLKCIRCAAEYALEYRLACAKCGGLLEFEYDLAAVAKLDLEAIPPRGIWRFHPVLPIPNPDVVVSLGEGGTPLIRCERYGAMVGVPKLFVKYEGSNPTGTLKDRSSATAISAAKLFGFDKTAVVTTGNAGASIAAYAARAGIKSVVFSYARAAPAKLYRMEACATRLVVVEGGYDEIAAVVSKHLERLHIFDSDARRNPYKHEGKKTLGYEMYFQFGRELPDFVLVPVSLGEMMVATWRAFKEMQQMGWTDRMPKLVACQSTAANPVTRAWEIGKGIVPQQVGYTIAEGVAVGNPGAKGDRALEAVRASEGMAVSVDDDQIVDAMDGLARMEGVWSGPTGALTIACLRKLARDGLIDRGATVACIVSETGLKGDFPPFPAAPQALDADRILRILEE